MGGTLVSQGYFMVRSSVAALAAALCLSLPAVAQVPLSALSLTARSHESLVNWQYMGPRPLGMPEIVSIPGHLLLDVRAVFDGPWSDTVERVQVNTSDIHLILPDGTELRTIGGHPYWGQMTALDRGISERRPRNFPTEDSDIHWNGIFRIPKGTAQVTLRITGTGAQFEGTIAVPGPTAPDDAASYAGFRVTHVRRFRTVTLSDGRDGAQILSSIRAPAGMVLADLEIEVTGLTSNQPDGDDQFSWSTNNFRLADGTGTPMGLIGERFMDRLLASQFNGIQIGRDTDRRVIWVVPEGLAEARLFFGETQVATVNLSGAAITDTD